MEFKCAYIHACCFSLDFFYILIIVILNSLILSTSESSLILQLFAFCLPDICALFCVPRNCLLAAGYSVKTEATVWSAVKVGGWISLLSSGAGLKFCCSHGNFHRTTFSNLLPRGHCCLGSNAYAMGFPALPAALSRGLPPRYLLVP